MEPHILTGTCVANHTKPNWVLFVYRRIFLKPEIQFLRFVLANSFNFMVAYFIWKHAAYIQVYPHAYGKR